MGTWISNYIHAKQWNSTTHPCHNFNGGFVKSSSKLWQGWGVAFNLKQWVYLFIPQFNFKIFWLFNLPVSAIYIKWPIQQCPAEVLLHKIVQDNNWRPQDKTLRPLDNKLRPLDVTWRSLYNNWRPPDDNWRPLDNNWRPLDDNWRPLDIKLRLLHKWRSLNNKLRPPDNKWRPQDNTWWLPDNTCRPSNNNLRPLDNKWRLLHVSGKSKSGGNN